MASYFSAGISEYRYVPQFFRTVPLKRIPWFSRSPSPSQYRLARARVSGCPMPDIRWFFHQLYRNRRFQSGRTGHVTVCGNRRYDESFGHALPGTASVAGCSKPGAKWILMLFAVVRSCQYPEGAAQRGRPVASEKDRFVIAKVPGANQCLNQLLRFRSPVESVVASGIPVRDATSLSRDTTRNKRVRASNSIGAFPERPDLFGRFRTSSS